jgi:hypothetical protein
MSQGLVQGDLIIPAAQGPGKAGAGRGERRKAQFRQKAGAAEVPWIRDDETAALVEIAEGPAA